MDEHLTIPLIDGRYFLLPDDVTYFDVMPEPTSEHHVGRFGLSIHPEVVTVSCIRGDADTQVGFQASVFDTSPQDADRLGDDWDARIDAVWVLARPGIVASGAFVRQGRIFDQPGRYHLTLLGRVSALDGANPEGTREEHRLLIWPEERVRP